MTSPNEPGHPRAGEGPGSANGAPAGPPGRVAAESSDVPPWQRGPGARANGPRPADAQRAPEAQRPAEPQRPAEAPRPAEPQRPSDAPRTTEAQRPPEPQRPPVRSPGADARIGQFIAGGPSTVNRDTEVVPTRAPERPEGQRSESYASELPDLSAPARPPRPANPPAPAEQRPSAPASRVQVAKKSHGPVRASMQIRRIDPWSTLKVSLVLSGVMFFVWMIAVAFLYLVLGGMGVWTKLNSNVGDLLTSDSGTGGELISSGTIFGGATLIGLVNIVLLTAMATAGAFIYNLITDLVGGVEVTLADRD